MISDRLKHALSNETDRANLRERIEEDVTVEPVNQNQESKVITSELEKEAFYIVRTILRTKIDATRITHRDTQSYFGILLDDNNRKPICRLFLESTRKFITLFDENKKEIKTEIKSLDDIYLYADHLLNTALSYDTKKEVLA